MFIIDTYLLAVIASVITMICWGSWPNTQKLVSKQWRFELFYWDYVIGILLTAFLFAFTLGSTGDVGRSFLDDLAQADESAKISASLGGLIFNAGNILLIASLSLSGMAVAFPIGVGLSMVIGIVINYIALPVGDPVFLFGGAGLVLLAIVFSALAYRKKTGDAVQSSSSRGVWLAVGAAVLFGLFYRYLAASMTSDFSNPEPGKLTPYTSIVFFGAGILISNFLFNTLLMRKPVQGTPVSYKDYFSGRARDHGFGILGGVIWGTGLVLSILSAGKAGFAISFGLGQGNALIAALWGVFVWKEFKQAPTGTGRYIALMFLCYVLGLLCIIYSR